MAIFDEAERERNKPKVKITSQVLKDGRLYASQDWVCGVASRRDPSVYPFTMAGRDCFLVGDGHKRIAKSLLEGSPIECDLDVPLGEIDEQIFRDSNYAAQKFAKFGIEGIFPFSQFISNFQKSQR
jgi:hypothetical protein